MGPGVSKLVFIVVLAVTSAYGNIFPRENDVVKTITHEVLWMTRCTVAQGRRPRATVHRVIHNTEGVIVLTVAQKAITPVFRQFKKDTTLQDSLASGSGRGPEAYGVSLLSCAISCAGVDGCESVFYGTVQGSCHHRHLIYNGSVDQDFSTAQGFEYYWATGVESPDIPQPPAFPPAPAPLPPPTSAPSPTDTTSSETGTCSKQEAAYVSDLGSCLYTHPVYMFGYSLAGSECAEVGGSLIELQTETKFLDVVIAVVDPGNEITTNFGFWTGAVYDKSAGYKWSDGTLITNISWAIGEPAGDSHCVAMMKSNGYRLSTESCSTTLDILCEMEASFDSK